MARGGKGIVLWSMVGTGITVTVNKAAQGTFPGPRILLGLAVIYIILGFVSDVAPTVAGPLAVLVFISVLLTNGGTALEGTIKAVNRPEKTKTQGDNLRPTRRDRGTVQ